MTTSKQPADGPDEPADVPTELLDLIEECVDRIQGGETPDFDGITRQFPDHSSSISDLLPTIAALTRCPDVSAGGSTVPSGSGPAIAPGTNRIGDYRLLRVIGRGGMGIVYEAEEISLRRRVALKVLPLSGDMDDRRIQRFRNEARAAAQLDHPNIVAVLAADDDNGTHYYAMRYVAGKDLAEVIRDLGEIAQEKDRARKDSLARSFSDSGGSSPSFPSKDLARDVSASGFTKRGSFICCTQIGIQAARALQYAHDAGIVHRDVKPSNLLLDSSGRVWLADFGLAQIKGEAGLSMTGDMIGTLRYMSPEQSLPDRVVVDHRTDIYSLGITLYELLTLHRAFDGGARKEVLRRISFDEPAPLRKLNPHIPVDLQTIISRAIARNPNDRYQTIGELADDLERFRLDQPIKARPLSLTRRFVKLAQRHRSLVASAAVLISIAIATAVSAAPLFWSFYLAEAAERERVEQLLKMSEGLRLVAHSVNQVDRNPARAMLLAIEGANRHHGPEANDALLAALDANHEHRTLIGHATPVGRAKFSPDGATVVTTATAFRNLDPAEPARVWDAESGRLLHTLDDATRITDAAYSPNGAMIVTTSSLPVQLAGDDRDVERSTRPPTCWYVSTGRKRFSLSNAFLFEMHPGVFSPDSSRLVTPGVGKTARVFRARDGEEVLTLRGHDRRVVFATFSPDGSMIATISDDDTVRFWDSGSGEEQHLLRWKDAAPDRPEIESLQFSPDNRRVLTGSEAYGVQLWDMETGESVFDRFLDGSLVRFTPDGRFILARNPYAEALNIYDAESGNVVRELKTPGWIKSVNLDPNGRRIVVCDFQHVEASLWNLQSGERQADFHGHEDTANSAAFSPDGRRIVTVSDDKTARIWNVESGRQQSQVDAEPADRSRPLFAFDSDGENLVVPSQAVQGITVRNPDTMEVLQRLPGRFYSEGPVGDRLLTRIDDRLEVWDLATSKQVAATVISEGDIRDMTFGPSERIALVLCEDGPVLAWDIDRNRKVVMRTDGVSARDAVFHPDGTQAAIALEDGRVVVCEVESGVVQTEFRHAAPVTSVRTSPDGNQLLTVTDQNTVVLRNLAAAPQSSEITIDDVHVNAARFSRDGKRFLTFHLYDGDAVNCHDSSTGDILHSIKITGLIRLATSPTGSQVAISSDRDGSVVWDYQTGDSHSLEAESTGAIAFSSDGSRVFVAPARQWNSTELVSDDEPRRFSRPVIRVYDAASGERISEHPMSRMTGMVRSHQTRKLLVTSGESYGAAIVSRKSNRTVRILDGHAAPLSFVGIPTERRKVITTSSDHTAAIWSIDSGEKTVLDRHADAITHAAISPNGSLLATGDMSGQCLLWNTDDGKFVAEFAGHTHQINFMTFDNDGDRLLTGSQDNSVREWNVATRIPTVLMEKNGAAFAEYSPDGSSLLIMPQVSEQEDVVVAGRSPRLMQPDEIRPGLVVHLVDRLGGQPFELRHDKPVMAAHYALDGSRILTLTSTGKVRVWDAQSGEQIAMEMAHGQRVHSLAVGPDDATVLLQSPSTAWLWDLNAGLRIMTLASEAGFRSSPQSVMREITPFSPDGSIVITRNDAGLRSWTRHPLEQAASAVPRSLTAPEMKRFQVKLDTQK